MKMDAGRGEAAQMSEEEELARRRAKAERSFLQDRKDHDVLEGEHQRVAKTAAKTAKLREQRLAKEAAELNGAPKAKPRTRRQKPMPSRARTRPHVAIRPCRP